MNIDHNKLSIADTIYLIGQLEHMRFHAIVAATNAPEDKTIELLVLAKQCQEVRRDIMQKHFSDVDHWGWCMIKVAGTLYQLTQELGKDDLDMIRQVKGIADSAVEIVTGKDISGCESCQKDKEE